MLRPPQRRQGCVGVGSSFGWMFYWMGVLWAGAIGYAVIRPWLLASFPPIFRHASGFELLMSAVASLSGIGIAGVVVIGAAALYDRLPRRSNESTASADTTVQSGETES
jgi:hypothetical protein